MRHSHLPRSEKRRNPLFKNTLALTGPMQQSSFGLYDDRDFEPDDPRWQVDGLSMLELAFAFGIPFPVLLNFLRAHGDVAGRFDLRGELYVQSKFAKPIGPLVTPEVWFVG